MLNKYEGIISEMGRKARGKTDTFDSSSKGGSEKKQQGLRGHLVVATGGGDVQTQQPQGYPVKTRPVTATRSGRTCQSLAP